MEFVLFKRFVGSRVEIAGHRPIRAYSSGG